MENIKKLFTNSPIIEIEYKYKNNIRKAYCKCEWYSLTGSIKDKVAFQIITDAYCSGELKTGQSIVEVSSGNMGISICAVANLYKNPVTIIMPRHLSEERKKLLKLYGATLIEVDNFKEAFEVCEEYKKKGYFCCNQFENLSNKKAHSEITAKEILSKIKNKKATCFVAGVGTSGTLSGVGEILKSELNFNIYAIEPQNARIITKSKPLKPHKLQGLSDEILPKLYNHNLCDKVIQVSDNDAIGMARKLCKSLSIGVGISSGANFIGCVISGENAVTVFSDDNKKYLSTSLTNDISSDLVNEIELIKFKVL